MKLKTIQTKEKPFEILVEIVFKSDHMLEFNHFYNSPTKNTFEKQIIQIKPAVHLPMPLLQ